MIRSKEKIILEQEKPNNFFYGSRKTKTINNKTIRKNRK